MTSTLLEAPWGVLGRDEALPLQSGVLMSRGAPTLELCTQACQKASQAVMTQDFHAIAVLLHESAGRYAQTQGGRSWRGFSAACM